VSDADKNPLMKDGLGPQAIKRIARSLALVVPGFNAKAFQKDAERGIDELELKARVHHLIAVLHRHYDLPFKKLSRHLHDLPEAWGRGSAVANEVESKAGFAAWPLIDYVAVHGLQYPKESLQTLEKLTHLFTAEFAVRPFIQQHPDITYAKLLEWCEHDSEHVRRLASEGSRPRLPWGMRLPQFINNPEPLAAILEKLKTDDSLYVRRSVANNLNDISKDNPEWMINLCSNWLTDSHLHTNWIVKHALRSLVKQGDVRVFPLLGYTAAPDVVASNIKLNKKHVSLGDSIGFSCAITGGKHAQNLVVDYVVYFMKANGKLAPKVFKLKNIALAANETLVIEKSYSFKPITTRRYYAGEHHLAIQINGKEVARTGFKLVD
jgi:3-methyladenine DNA glycosylase AlkC